VRKTPLSARWAAAAIVAAAIAVFPASPAHAEGAGYGGNADKLTVQWQASSLDISGVGFRAGSTVSVRVGSSAERVVTAEPDGSLRLGLTTLEQQAADHKSAGTSVLALGTSPAGTVVTLVGAIPPAAEGKGLQDLTFWLLAGAAVAAMGTAGLRKFKHAPRGRHAR
jgi:hypothetical protein